MVLTLTNYEQKNQEVRVSKSENIVRSHNTNFDQMSNKLALANSMIKNVSYRYDKETDTVVVSVHDNNTQQVIRQIPTQEFLDMKLSIQNHIGKILDRVG